VRSLARACKINQPVFFRFRLLPLLIALSCRIAAAPVVAGLVRPGAERAAVTTTGRRRLSWLQPTEHGQAPVGLGVDEGLGDVHGSVDGGAHGGHQRSALLVPSAGQLARHVTVELPHHLEHLDQLPDKDGAPLLGQSLHRSHTALPVLVAHSAYAQWSAAGCL
jgi:hypothetical protein